MENREEPKDAFFYISAILYTIFLICFVIGSLIVIWGSETSFGSLGVKLIFTSLIALVIGRIIQSGAKDY